MAQSPVSAKDELALMTEIWDPAIADDPLAFVMFIYPWGKAGTPLANFTGPRKWQRDELTKMRDHIAANKNLMRQGLAPLVYRSATVSGRGPGKSAFVSWVDHWFKSCVLGGTSIITANTEQQLKTRTWAEGGKWNTLALNSHWFDRSALSSKPAPWFDEALKKQLKIDTGYYYSQAQLWSEENPDAFAGAHNHNGILVEYDEASGIPPAIWKVTEGFFTEPVLHRYWFVFSNGRRNTGSFFECFHRDRDRWNRRQIDSRTVEGTDPAVYQGIIDAYGEDSDEARVEVKGEFPRQGDKQFVSRSIIEAAAEREDIDESWAPLMMGVDPARFGDDCTVIRFRQGRNARIIPPIRMKGADNMAVANECARLIEKYDPDAVCIDAGNGTGIIDRLRELKYKVHEVWFGAASPQPEWANNRTFMWAKMRDWLGGACIDKDDDLIADLAGPFYGFQGSSDKIILEAKEAMKKRGIASPDHADALACTFAVQVASASLKAARGLKRDRKTPMARDVDYSIFG